MDAERWDRRYAAGERVPSSDPHPLVVDALSEAAPGRALDLASGPGRHARWLASRGWKVTAVDFSSVAIEQGRRECEDVVWIVADAYDYEPPRGAFDLVLIVNFHPRPTDRGRVFDGMARALSPGGALLVVGRHVDDIGRDGGRGPSNPDLRYRPEVVRAALPASLTVERCESVQRGDLTDVVALARAS